MSVKSLFRLSLMISALNFFTANANFPINRPVLLDPPYSVTIKNTRILSNLYFDQKVDHFNPIDTRTWKQRYHTNEDYYNETHKNHIFLMLAGEWEATERWLNYGSWLETANQFGALLIYLEHRFYGASQPFSDLSTENLQYLSTHQALADTANFIQGISTLYNLTSDARWIVFGGSYAGTLAAWARHKYPHLVAGAVSSSAPLEAIVDFREYLEVVKNGLSTHSQDCVDNIKTAYSELDVIVSDCLEDTETYKNLDDTLQLCDPIELSEGNEKDLSSLFQYLTDNNFAYVVQYNGLLNLTVDTLCEIMVNETGGATNLQKLGEINDRLLQLSGLNCTDYKYANLVASLQNTLIEPSSFMRQWVYQTCTEFGFFSTSSQDRPIFGSRFDKTYFTDICVDVFGEMFNETLTTMGVRTTNNMYGATNIAASNIVYFHGTLDPWHVLGKLRTSEKFQDKVIVVDGLSHCANMYPTKANDPEDLVAARAEINKLIGEWLGVGDITNGNSCTKASLSMYILFFSMMLIYLGKLI